MADRSIDKREQYVAFATHCLQLAKAAADRQSRAVLKERAAEWLRLEEAAGQFRQPARNMHVKFRLGV
jgi:hypothetical protein